MKAEPVIVERTLQAPISKVWKALTDPRQIKSWYFDIESFKAEPGFEFVFYGGDNEVQWAHYCKVLEAVKEKKLSYTWSYDEFPGAITTVTWELFAGDNNTTIVRITHTGLEKFPQDNKNFRRQSFNDGWTYILGISLKDYVEQHFIEHTLNLSASPEQVWKTITDHETIKKWAAAFHEGTYVESDWQPGHEVIWRDGLGAIGARGVVVTNEPNKALRLAYYDDVNTKPPAEPGKYNEFFKIEQHNGQTQLFISCGPLEQEHFNLHQSKWSKAIELLQQTAEARS
jgi:Uncharacterized conserved protein